MTVLGDDALAQLLARARTAWPAITVAEDAFGQRVAAILEDGTVAVDELFVDDLYLAAACLAGDPVALAAFDRLLVPVRATLLRARYDSALVDDALQMMRYRLLVATPERTAKLATYRGRGTLSGWLRVVALRQVRELAGRPTLERSDSALAVAMTEADAAIAVLARTHGPAIRRMFREALATLDDRQRELLRLEIVEAMPHQRIAELHGVHRTSALRWIDDARAKLAREVRRRLKHELKLGDESAASLLRVLAGQVDLSLASGLLAQQPSSEQ